MPRNMSFALTTDQFCDRTKTVTRRLNWWEDKNGRRILKPGDVVNGCVKCMGLKPGERIERLGQIRIVDVRREPLDRMESKFDLGRPRFNPTAYDYGNIEAVKEGFPGLTGSEFVRMFCEHMKVIPSDEVTRIEFEYLEATDG